MIVAHPADERSPLNLVITATFTAEPTEESLTFWMRQLAYHLYRNLARHLAPRRTVYGLQPYRKKGFPLLHTRIEEMVDYYLQQMQTVQPQVPYLIGGMCAGGVIAFEVARQLQKKEEIAALVAISDATDQLASKKIGRITSQRLKRFNAGIGEKKNLLSFLNTIHVKNVKPMRLPKYWFDSRKRYFLKNHGLLYTMMADFCWILGYSSWRGRRILQRKPDLDLPVF